MMHPPDEQLSAYLDGALSPGESASLEAHLTACESCRSLLAELRRVLARAQSLEDRAPREDLWPGVAAAIGAGTRGSRRISFSFPELLAAGIAVMLISGGLAAAWLRTPGRPSEMGAERPASGAPGPTLAAATTGGSRGYDAAIQELERELVRGRGQLDSVTVRVVEQKLALIDRAIIEAEQALATDSSDTYLNGHLARTRRQKLELLRHAAALSRPVS